MIHDFSVWLRIGSKPADINWFRSRTGMVISGSQVNYPCYILNCIITISNLNICFRNLDFTQLELKMDLTNLLPFSLPVQNLSLCNKIFNDFVREGGDYGLLSNQSSKSYVNVFLFVGLTNLWDIVLFLQITGFFPIALFCLQTLKKLFEGNSYK